MNHTATPRPVETGPPRRTGEANTTTMSNTPAARRISSSGAGRREHRGAALAGAGQGVAGRDDGVVTLRDADSGSDENVSLGRRLRRVIGVWVYSQHRLVVLAAEFADSVEWATDGSPTAAHWLAAMADVETCTAREWIRIGRQLRHLPAIATAFADGTLSYSKVRALTRVADPDNETELLALAAGVSATELGRVIAAWLTANTDPELLEQHQHQARSVKWRTEPDGMVTFTMRLPPLLAGVLITMLTIIAMKTMKRRQDGVWPTAAQQYCDGLEQVLTEGCGPVSTEVVVHVRADGTVSMTTTHHLPVLM